MRKAEGFVFILSLAGVLAAYAVAERVFEGLPHVEDEMAYVWQAKVFAHGKLTAPTPSDAQNMQVPFVVDEHGQRFAKYPPGWPVVLAFGVLLGIRPWINPLLAGLALWLTFRLGQKLFDTRTGVLAVLLTLSSPFFLINSGSLNSHPWSLVLSLAFILAWLDAFGKEHRAETNTKWNVPPWVCVGVAGLSLGLLALTRPLTALGVALPFFIHGILLLWRSQNEIRSRVIAVGAIALAVGCLLLLWQYGVTGSPTTNPYTLWWPFDRIGFGSGVGLEPGGHTLMLGLRNAGIMLSEVAKDLFGWGIFSWLFLPFGLWAIRRSREAWLPFSVFASLVFVYIFYWAWVGHYGPRYYYEGLYGLTLISALGILWLAGSRTDLHWRSWRTLGTGLLTLALVAYNLGFSLPTQLNSLYGLYGVHRAQLEPFLTPQARGMTPALVIVHVQKNWTEYAGLLELEDPWLTSPFIFARSSGPVEDAALVRANPARRAIYYYPDEPNKFYTVPR